MLVTHSWALMIFPGYHRQNGWRNLKPADGQPRIDEANLSKDLPGNIGAQTKPLRQAASLKSCF
jgi:hypothetical protein